MTSVKPPKIGLEDWYGLCEKYLSETGVKLCWSEGMSGCDFDDGDAFSTNREFIQYLNSMLEAKAKEVGNG